MAKQINTFKRISKITSNLEHVLYHRPNWMERKVELTQSTRPAVVLGALISVSNRPGSVALAEVPGGYTINADDFTLLSTVGDKTVTGTTARNRLVSMLRSVSPDSMSVCNIHVHGSPFCYMSTPANLADALSGPVDNGMVVATKMRSNGVYCTITMPGKVLQDAIPYITIHEDLVDVTLHMIRSTKQIDKSMSEQ